MEKPSKKVTNILIASVGGQGGLTLSRAIAIAAVMKGYSVKTGESLGMAQRFGSVVSYVRIGKEVRAPIFGVGDADYLIGLELTETVRNMQYLRQGGLAVVSDELKPPLSASLGLARSLSREELIGDLKNNLKNLVLVPAKELAIKAGNPRAANMVLLGVFNELTKLIDDASIKAAIMMLLPGRRGESSVQAFELGKEWVKSIK
ncbi:MAG: indolepyruvate oxidoreductase subunit beta [Desulfurococcales archaeon]|nr:indolepyruvate oxidoreductase subunit beta [Desulfurococcales archaeon]